MLIGPQPRWFHSQNLRLAEASGSGFVRTRVVGVILSSASAPVPVTSLYVEPGGYCSLDRVVEERLVRVVRGASRTSLALIPRAKSVVVVGRQADHREDLAGLGVHDDDDAALEAGRASCPTGAPSGRASARCVSIVSSSESPATARALTVCEDLELPARGVPLDGLRAVRAAELRSRSTPRRRSCRGGRRAGSPAPCRSASSSAADRARVAEDLRERAGPSGYCAAGLDDDLDARQRRRSPRRSGGRSRSGRPCATRTRSNREPGLQSIAALMSRRIDAEQRRRAGRRPRRAASSGRSAGRILTANVGTFVTSGDAVAVVDQAAGRRDRLDAPCGCPRSGWRTGRRSTTWR